MTERSAAEQPATESLEVRFGRVLEHLRGDGRWNVDSFLRSYEAGHAGSLVVKVPSRKGTGKTDGVPEVRFLPSEVEITIRAQW